MTFPAHAFLLIAIGGVAWALIAARRSRLRSGGPRSCRRLPIGRLAVVVLLIVLYLGAARFRDSRRDSATGHSIAHHAAWHPVAAGEGWAFESHESPRWENWHGGDTYHYGEPLTLDSPVLANGSFTQPPADFSHDDMEHRAGNAHESGTSSSPKVFFDGIGLLAIVLLLVAVTAIAPVLLAAVGGCSALRNGLSRATGLLWGVPVVAVLLLFVARFWSRAEHDIRKPPPPAVSEVNLAAVQSGGRISYVGAMTLPTERPRTEAERVRLEQTARDAAQLAVAEDHAPPTVPLVDPNGDSGPTGSEETAADASSGNRPDWISQPPARYGDTTLVVVKSRQFSTIDEAHSDALDQAVHEIRNDFRSFYDSRGPWTVPRKLVETAAVRQRFVETIHRQTTTSQTPFEMKRVYLLVELSPAVREQFYHPWRSQIVSRRLRGLGGVAGLLTLIFATSAAYFRLDARTNGEYRRRLKVASVSLIVVGGLVAAAIA